MTTFRVTYGAAVGSNLTDEEAQEAGAFLDAEFGERPRTPQEVVDAARSEEAPIHRHFEWDDFKAAEEHRRNQARHLLRSIVISSEGEEDVRAYHHVHVVSEGGVLPAYLPASVVWSRSEFAQQVVEQARSELRAWTKKYRHYKQLSDLVSAVEETLVEKEEGRAGD